MRFFDRDGVRSWRVPEDLDQGPGISACGGGGRSSDDAKQALTRSELEDLNTAIYSSATITRNHVKSSDHLQHKVGHPWTEEENLARR